MKKLLKGLGIGLVATMMMGGLAGCSSSESASTTASPSPSTEVAATTETESSGAGTEEIGRAHV